MFCLENKNFQLALQAVPVKALLQHEKTLSGPVRKLTLALKFKHIAAFGINYFHEMQEWENGKHINALNRAVLPHQSA